MIYSRYNRCGTIIQNKYTFFLRKLPFVNAMFFHELRTRPGSIFEYTRVMFFVLSVQHVKKPYRTSALIHLVLKYT